MMMGYRRMPAAALRATSPALFGAGEAKTRLGSPVKRGSCHGVTEGAFGSPGVTL